jgi:cytochrome c oxidase subunit II
VISDLSTSSAHVDSVFYFILICSIILLLGITITMIYFTIRYNRNRNPVASNIDGNVTLEIIWTAIPTILVLTMFYYGWAGFAAMRSVPPGAIPVNVIGKMWEWHFIYENGKESSILVAPVNRPVVLHLRSLDVIHSFYIPAFKIKEDAVPGFQNYLWFEAKKKGAYDVLCAQYCGLKHSEMLARILIVEEREYKEWLDTKEKEIAGSRRHPAFTIMMERGCTKCHTSDGSDLSGASFKGMFGKSESVLSGGTHQKIVVDETYIRKKILNPTLRVVEGRRNIMPPPAPDLTEDEIKAMIDYIRSLKEEGKS